MIDHRMEVIRSPINHLVKCSCGWSRTIPRQNALARAAKVKSAIRQHEREIQDRTGGTDGRDHRIR